MRARTKHTNIHTERQTAIHVRISCELCTHNSAHQPKSRKLMQGPVFYTRNDLTRMWWFSTKQRLPRSFVFFFFCSEVSHITDKPISLSLFHCLFSLLFSYFPFRRCVSLSPCTSIVHGFCLHTNYHRLYNTFNVFVPIKATLFSLFNLLELVNVIICVYVSMNDT